jgi:hypothetical protein
MLLLHFRIQQHALYPHLILGFLLKVLRMSFDNAPLLHILILSR